MKYYTIENVSGDRAKIAVPDGTHTQHIWNESALYISEGTFRRVWRLLGAGPYRAATPCCGPHYPAVVLRARGGLK